jgi:hypothetical protein
MWVKQKIVRPLECMATVPPPTIQTIYPFQSQSTLNLTNSLLFLLNVHVLFNLPPNINHIIHSHLQLSSFCSLHTAFSDNFHSILPPSLPLLPSSCSFPSDSSWNYHTMSSLPFVHTHLFSSDWERYLWLSKYIDCACVFICAFHP